MKFFPLIVFLFILLCNKSFAYSAYIYGCNVNIPENFMVDTRFEGNHAVIFKDRGVVGGGTFSIRDIGQVSNALSEFDEMVEQGTVSVVDKYQQNGFSITEYTSSLGQFDVVAGKDQLGVFYFQSRSVWPSLVKNCDGGLRESQVKDVTSNNTCSIRNRAADIVSSLNKFAKVAVVRNNNKITAYRLYNVQSELAELGIQSGDIVTEICGSKIESVLGRCDCETIKLENQKGEVTEVDITHLLEKG